MLSRLIIFILVTLCASCASQTPAQKNHSMHPVQQEAYNRVN